ncbi:MAG: endonuclease/exonuclease/phosphatase family protein [Proteobacteria bacterium]|nr:endonuclease/exonuclease/phosphatase family protein [Pseudomonadota bacterium]
MFTRLITLIVLASSFSLYAKPLKIMQYNIENSFDTTFDDGTDDFTYLPVATKRNMKGHADFCRSMGSPFYKDQCLNLDWNEAKFTKKLLGIARVIKSFDASGKGPDIIFVQEVENKNVLSKLVSKGLSGMGYQHIALLEGDDKRGIDVGIISRFPIVNSQIHSLIINGNRIDTRGILEVELQVEDQKVVLFNNHWPSQGNPTSHRVASAEQLSKLAERHTQTADLILAAGDFNTIESEVPYPLSFLKNFEDVVALARKAGYTLHPGTHFFRGEWGSLDRVFVHKASAIKPKLSTVEIMNRDFVLKKEQGTMVPNRFDFVTAEGFSDHLGIAVEFNY